MTIDETRHRVKTIKERFQAQMDQLFADVLHDRHYQDGDLVERTRHNPDGSVYDHIRAIVTYADVTLYTDDATDYAYPNVHYWVWVLTPGYRTHQSFIKNRTEVIPYNMAEDFWQGDARWQVVTDSTATDQLV